MRRGRSTGVNPSVGSGDGAADGHRHRYGTSGGTSDRAGGDYGTGGDYGYSVGTGTGGEPRWTAVNPLVTAAAVAGIAVLAVAGWPGWWSAPAGGRTAGALADALAMAEVGALLLARRSPAACFVLAELALVAYGLLGYPTTPAGYAGLGATAIVGWRGRSPAARRLALVAAVAGVVVIGAARSPNANGAVIVVNAILVALAWLGGAELRLTSERHAAAARAQRETARRELAEHRLAVAIALHDRIGHAITAGLRQLEAARVLPGDEGERMVDGAAAELRDALGSVSELVGSWGTPGDGGPAAEAAPAAAGPTGATTPAGMPGTAGIGTAGMPGAAGIGTAADGTPPPLAGLPVPGLAGTLGTVLGRWIGRLGPVGVELRLAVRGDPLRITPDQDALVAEVLEQALANVARHSAATVVDVGLHVGPDAATVSVADPGPARAGPGGSGTGLERLRRHLADAGGTLDLTGTGQPGFTVRASVPARAASHASRSGR